MKGKRQAMILALIEKYDIETQDELIERLRIEGFDAAQATISRDIKDLKLTKVPAGKGAYKYIRQKAGGDGFSIAMLNVPILSSVRSADYAQNIIVIKTIPSMASAIAAGIDGMNIREVLGCVAGDDCVIVITRSEDDASAICGRLRELIRIA